MVFVHFPHHRRNILTMEYLQSSNIDDEQRPSYMETHLINEHD